MEIYLVGGAVRDRLLGRPVKERDWVVVGATVEDMRAKGFFPVGKTFPVFLHPQTREEYALARTERKVGKGYHGFEFFTSPDVTLEEDLSRRDLTINAIAEDKAGSIIDPYGGVEDLKNHLLRHVSPAFAEDPVRILRIARFAARYAHLDFMVAPETFQLMKNMVQAGEVDALVSERIWKEWEQALTEDSPEVFLEVLQQCGALQRLAPEIASKLLDLPIIATLKTVVPLESNAIVRFAASVVALGEEGQAGIVAVKNLSERLLLPQMHKELAKLAVTYLTNCEQAPQLTPLEVTVLLERLDALRRSTRFQQLMTVYTAYAHAKKQSVDFVQILTQCALALQQTSFMTPTLQRLPGKEIKDRLRKLRAQVIAKVLSQRE